MTWREGRELRYDGQWRAAKPQYGGIELETPGLCDVMCRGVPRGGDGSRDRGFGAVLCGSPHRHLGSILPCSE